MSRRPLLKTVLAAIAAGMVLTACAGAPESSKAKVDAGSDYPRQVETCGFETTLKAKPKRVVTMNQSATEIALALGAHDQLIGTADSNAETISPKWKKQFDSIEVLADEYPSFEKLLSVKPDFVYAVYSSAFNKEYLGPREGFEKLGIATYLSPFGCKGGGAGTKIEVSFESVWKDIDNVAEVLGVPERAAEIKKEQSSLLDQLARDRQGDGLNILWLDMIGKTATVGAGKGGPQLIIEAIGGKNVFGNLDGGWADASWEDVVKADPDVIVLAELSGDTIADKKAYLAKDPVLRQLDAVKQKRYVTIPFVEGTPGVRLADGAKLVADQFDVLDLN